MTERELAIEKSLINVKVDGEVYEWKYWYDICIPPERVKKIKEDLIKKLLEKLK